MEAAALLAGRVVLLTGTGEPAAASARAVLAHGATVVLTDATGVPETAPARTALLPSGVGGPDTFAQAVETALERFGRLDHLVNVVPSRLPGRPLLDLDPLTLRDDLYRQLAQPLAWTQQVCRHWMTTHGGSVVNLVPDVVRDAAQDAALAALIQLTDWLAAELTPQVGVHTVVPGAGLDPETYRTSAAEALTGLLARGGARGGQGAVLVLTEQRIRARSAA